MGNGKWETKLKADNTQFMYTTYVVRSYIQILTGSADVSPGSVVLQQMAVKYCVSNYSDSLEPGL